MTAIPFLSKNLNSDWVYLGFSLFSVFSYILFFFLSVSLFPVFNHGFPAKLKI